MLDISHIKTDWVELFALGYRAAVEEFGVEPLQASAKVQKKIRRFVGRQYLDGEDFSEAVMQYIAPTVEDAVFIEFLQACHQQAKKDETWIRQHFDRVTADWPADAKYALQLLTDMHTVSGEFRQVGEDALFQVCFGGGYDLTLIFHNATGVPHDYDFISFQQQAINRTEVGYCLVGECEDMEHDVIQPFALHFTHAAAAVQVYKATGCTFFQSPWESLWMMEREIIDKSEILGEYLNEQEKALLPLLKEAVRLSVWNNLTREPENKGFALLKPLAIHCGCGGLIPLLEQVEQEADAHKTNRLIDKICTRLNHKQYESLWRELYRQIEQSQAGYPSRAEQICKGEHLQEVREQIGLLMGYHGYTGTYPDFVKIGPMKKLHLAGSYGLSYFVGWEKQVAYHIHCTEEVQEDGLLIQFLCGTQLLGKDEAPADAYFCTFDAKGKRFFNEVSCLLENEQDFCTLGQRVQIAVKKAELLRLTKEERRSIKDVYVATWWLFLLAFLVMGGLFAVLFTPAMMGFAAVMLWIGGEPLAGLWTLPWWWLFGLAFVGFGLPMAVIEVLLKRK